MAEKVNMIDEKIHFKSGSDFVDASLNYLLAEPKYKNVKFNRNWVIPSNLNFAPIDITSLFMNLLTNAFEATVKCDNEQYVNVKINAQSDFLYISIENSYNGEVNIENNVLKSTKTNKEQHGFGTQIITDIVAKYGGKLSFENHANKFVVEIVFDDTIYR